MTLYLYRVGWAYLAKNSVYRSKSIKSLVVLGLCLDRSDPPVRPVGRARPATTSQTSQTAWDDRSDQLVWCAVIFDCQQFASAIFTVETNLVVLMVMHLSITTGVSEIFRGKIDYYVLESSKQPIC